MEGTCLGCGEGQIGGDLGIVLPMYLGLYAKFVGQSHKGLYI